LDALDIAWRKRYGGFHSEADGFVIRIDKTAHGLPTLGEAQQNTHRLEKVETSGVLAQQPLDFAKLRPLSYF